MSNESTVVVVVPESTKLVNRSIVLPALLLRMRAVRPGSPPRSVMVVAHLLTSAGKVTWASRFAAIRETVTPP
jgi:hypothetical protein